MHYVVVNLVFVLVVVGGIDAYVATYDKIAEFTRILPTGATAAFVLTVVAAIAWGLFYSVIQVLVYERALARWPAGPQDDETHVPAAESRRVPRRTIAILLAVAAAWAALLASTAPLTLAIVAVALALAWLVTGEFPRDVVAGRCVAVRRARDLGDGPGDRSAPSTSTTPHAAPCASSCWCCRRRGRGRRSARPGLRDAAHRGLWRARRLPAAAEAADVTAPPRVRHTADRRRSRAHRSDARRPAETAAGRRRADRLGGGRGRRRTNAAAVP